MRGKKRLIPIVALLFLARLAVVPAWATDASLPQILPELKDGPAMSLEPAVPNGTAPEWEVTQNSAPIQLTKPNLTETAQPPKPIPNPATAETKATKKPGVVATVGVRVGQHDKFDRVVFDWPSAVSYKTTRNGNRAVIRFGSAGTTSLSPTTSLTRANNFSSANDADGHLVVSFEINPKAELKDFFNEASIAVDIIGPSVKADAPKVVAKDDKPKAQAVAATAPPAPAPQAFPATASQKVAASVGTAAPAASASQAVPAVTAVQISTTLPRADSASNSAKTAESSPDKASAVVIGASAPRAAPAVAQTSQALSQLNITAKPLLVATLDPHTPLRAAVWARGGYGTIVFDRKLTLSAEALSQGAPGAVVALEALDIAKASGFRFRIPANTEVHANRDGTAWKIYLTRQQPEVPVSATLVAQPDFALGPRYLLPLPDAPDPIRYTDPVVGDELIVVPLNQTQAFSIERNMADFQIWPAALGMVIKPLADKLIVRAVSDGIEISSESVLHLSPAVETGEAQQSSQKARSAVAGKSLFDFAGWRGKSDETFTQTRQRLQQTIVDVPERERDRARLELARFYFARGYGQEALALLQLLAKEVPDLEMHADFLALSGAAKILSYHPDEGLKDLEAANLPAQPEIKLWQAVGYAELRNWTEAEDHFASSEALLAGYPEPFYSRFFVLAVESAAAVGNNQESADWLDIVETAVHNPEINPAIDYLHGVLHAKSGRAQAAADAWKAVAASNDRLYKVRAELALIDLGVANKSLTPAQAADRLEALRFAWRGDDLEVDILHRLGQFYIQARNIKSGLGILSQAARLYPDSPLMPRIHDEMSTTFHDIFLGDIGKDLSPLEALTLYQQYHNTLMPTGEEGIGVTRNLAERLAAIDLLDQAGDLLQDIVEHKLTGIEKARVAGRLAAIRLIDHKPQQALDALDLSSNDPLPENVQRERALLRAKGLSQLHREDDALALLKDDNRFPAKLLRADINMRAQHWADAAKNLLELIGPAPRPGDTLRSDQADWLVRCAVAMAMTGDQVGLDKLAIDYGAAMAATSQNNTFRVLVQPEKQGQMRDISSAQTQISDVDLFQGFLDSFRKTEDSGDQQAAKKP